MSALYHKQTFCAAAEIDVIRSARRRWRAATAARSARVPNWDSSIGGKWLELLKQVAPVELLNELVDRPGRSVCS
jgi:hypothetical protein